MKKIILVLLIVCGLTANSFAQKGEKMQAIKVAYITREVNLTEDEAQKFWPVYNKYFEELKTARDQNKADELAFEEKSLAIRKRYKADFKKILVDDARVNTVFVVDRNFMEMLKNRLQDRKKNNRNKSGKPA